MGQLQAHVQTWRPYTLWYVGLVGLAGSGLAEPGRDLWLLLAAWLTPTIGWIGGHYLSDYFDRRLDAISKPHRPIPSGRLRPGVALSCGVAALIAVGILAAAGGWRTSLVAVLAMAGILGYGLRLKARGLAGNLARGALGALVLLYGAVLIAPPAWRLVPFVLAFWLHDTASNLVGTLRDVTGDSSGGYRTLPVRRGSLVAARTALALYCLAIGAAALGAPNHPGYLLGLAAAAVFGVAAFAPLLAGRNRLTERTALRSHELLVLERLILAGTIIGLGLGSLPATALLLPTLVLSWWTQRRMRAGYELGPVHS